MAVFTQGLSPNQIRALAGGASPAALPAADPLAAQWVADDYAGGNWVDRVGSIGAVVEGDPSGQANQLNGHAVVNFDGDDAFRIAAADSPLALVGDYTVVAVFRTATAGAGGAGQWYQNSGIVDMEIGGSTNDWGLVLNGSGQIGAGLGGPDHTRYSDQTGLNDSAGHVALYTRQGGNIGLYVDGGLAQTDSGAGANERRANDFTVGRRQTGGNFYTGDLAEVRIYEGRLTPGAANLLTMDLARTYGFAGAGNWIGAAGPWDVAGNWSAGVPDSLTDATINNGGTAQLASGTAAAGSLTIGGAGPGTLQWTGGTLDTWDITVGAGGTLDRSGLADHWAYGGRLQVDSGQVLMPAATYELRLNEGAEMSLTGTGSVSNFHAVIVGAAGDTNTVQTVSVADNAQMTGLNYIIVGKDGHKGQILQSGGTVGTTHLFLGEFGAAEGNYVLTSGAVNVGNDIMVGKENIGTFTQMGGDVSAGGGNSLIIAVQPGSLGAYTMSDGTLSLAGNFQIGARDRGLFDQSGGNVSWGGWMAVGRYDGGQGVYQLHGNAVSQGVHAIVAEDAGSFGRIELADNASLTIDDDLEVGRNGIGVVSQTGGSLTVGDILYIRPGSAFQQSSGMVTTPRTLMWGTPASPGVMELSGDANYHNTAYMSVGTRDGDVGILRVRDNAQLLVDTDFNVSDQAGSTGTFYLDGGEATGGTVYIGKSDNTSGTLIQTGGRLTSNGDLFIADAGASTGTVTLNDGEIVVNGGVMRVGDLGAAIMDQTGGSVTTANWFVVGQGGSQTSTYNLSGGTLDVNTNGGNEKLQVGVWDTVDAHFNVSGDAQVTVHGGGGEAGGIQVGGDHATAQGTMTVADTASIAAPWLTVGFNGPGTLTQTGGAISIGGNPQVGRSTTGTYNQSGGTFNWGGWFAVGRLDGGNGAFNLSGTASASGNNMIVAEAPGATGTMTVADLASLTLNHFEVARNGDGSLTQTGGLIAVRNNPQIGVNTAGTFDHTGGVFYHVDHTAVGRSSGGNGTYHVGGDAINSGRWMILAEDPGTTGSMSVGGDATITLGGSHVSPSLEVARNGTATLDQTGGFVFADSARITDGAGSQGTYNLQGGVLETRQLTMGGGAAAFNFTGGALRPGTVGFSLNNDGGTLDVATPMTAGFNARWYDGNDMTQFPDTWDPNTPAAYSEVVDAVNWQASGNWPLSGFPPGWAYGTDHFGVVYTGSIYSPADANVSFRELVDDGAILYVDGVKVLEDTIFNPGGPWGDPWNQHTSTTVALSEGWHAIEFRTSDGVGGENARLEWDPTGGQDWSLLVGGAVFADLGDEIGTSTIQGDYTQTAAGVLAIDIDAAGGTNDKLVVEGTLNARGTLQVSLLSGEPEVGSVFDVLDFNLVGSEFDTLDLPAFSLPGVRWNTDRLYTTGELSVVVPEPATWALFGLGALLLYLGTRKRRQ